MEVVEGDPSRPATLAPHLDGVGTLFLHPRAFGESAGELLALARERGVTRVVALAAFNIDDPLDEQPSRLRGDRNKECEAAAVASGLEWTSLRPAAFAGNSIGAWGRQICAGDVVRYVHASFAEAPIDERDLAEIIARVLVDGGFAGRRLELTGPRSITHEQMVAAIGAAIGRPLRWEEVPPETFTRHLAQAGLPRLFVEGLLARYARHAGKPHRVTGDAAEVLGRPARTFAAWAAEHAGAFRA